MLILGQFENVSQGYISRFYIVVILNVHKLFLIIFLKPRFLLFLFLQLFHFKSMLNFYCEMTAIYNISKQKFLC